MGFVVLFSIWRIAYALMHFFGKYHYVYHLYGWWDMLSTFLLALVVGPIGMKLQEISGYGFLGTIIIYLAVVIILILFIIFPTPVAVLPWLVI